MHINPDLIQTLESSELSEDDKVAILFILFSIEINPVYPDVWKKLTKAPIHITEHHMNICSTLALTTDVKGNLIVKYPIYKEGREKNDVSELYTLLALHNINQMGYIDNPQEWNIRDAQDKELLKTVTLDEIEKVMPQIVEYYSVATKAMKLFRLIPTLI